MIIRCRKYFHVQRIFLKRFFTTFAKIPKASRFHSLAPFLSTFVIVFAPLSSLALAQSQLWGGNGIPVGMATVGDKNASVKKCIAVRVEKVC